MLIPRFAAPIIALGMIVLGSGPAFGQAYPNKIIRIITAAAGGGSDFIARELAQGISGPLGQQIIVENRGTGVLAGEAASKAPPDGYTLTVQGGAFWIFPLLRKAPYDPIADFSPISLVVREVNVLAVHPGLPTVSDSGLPGFESIGMTGIFATGKPPAAIIDRVNQEIVRFLARTEVKERFLKSGVEIVGSSPEQFAEAVRADRGRVSKVVE